MITNIVEKVPEAAFRHASVDRERCALLLIDMQEFFREVVQPVLPKVVELVEACRNLNVPVLFTQHGYDDPEKDSGMLGEWWGDPIVVGSKRWTLLPEILPREDEKVIAKKRYSAYYGTDLETYLHSLGVDDVIIGGVMTNLCCETTARDAFVRDFRVFFLVDGTATASEAYHVATLRNLAYGFAYLKRCEEVVEELRGEC